MCFAIWKGGRIDFEEVLELGRIIVAVGSGMILLAEVVLRKRDIEPFATMTQKTEPEHYNLNSSDYFK